MSEAVLDRLIDASIQGLIAFTVVWLLVLAVRRMSPNMRGWLWRLCGLKLLVSLVAIIGIPLLPAPTISLSEDWAPLPSMPLSLSDEVASVATPAIGPGPSFDIPQTMILIWLVGAAGLGVYRFALGKAARSRLLRDASPLESDLPVAALTAQKLGLKRVPRIYVSDRVSSPLVVGLWKPFLILPRAILVHPQHLELALAHEMAHLRRRDLLWQAVLAVPSLVFWFLPTAHWTAKNAKEEAEMSCDLLVLQTTHTNPAQYSRLLVALACRDSSFSGAAAMAARSRKHLEKRILSMNHSQNLKIWALMLAGLVIVPALVPWQAIAQEPKTTFIPASGQKLEDVILFRHYYGTEKELGITPEQKAAMEEQMNKAQAETRALGQKLADMKAAKVDKKEILAYDTKVRMPMFRRHHKAQWDILTPAQQERSRQIAYQFYGPMLLSNPELAKEVGLSETTKAKIVALNEGYRDFINRQNNQLFDASFLVKASNEPPTRPFTSSEKKRIAQLTKQIKTAEGPNKRVLQKELQLIQMRVIKYEPLPYSEENQKKWQAERAAQTKSLMDNRSRRFMADSAKAMALLSPSAKAKWAALQGKPFQFTPHIVGGQRVIDYR